MKIQEAQEDIEKFMKKRFEQLKEEMGENPIGTPAMSVTFAPQMRIHFTPVALPDIQPGNYIDKSNTVFAEVLHVNHHNNIVQMEVHMVGEDSESRTFETMSTGLFSKMFAKFENPQG